MVHIIIYSVHVRNMSDFNEKYNVKDMNEVVQNVLINAHYVSAYIAYTGC